MLSSVLVTLIIGLILIALIVYGLTYLSPPLDANIVRLIQAAVVIIGALVLAQKLGAF